jgi:hypothetical protein
MGLGEVSSRLSVYIFAIVILKSRRGSETITTSTSLPSMMHYEYCFHSLCVLEQTFVS